MTEQSAHRPGEPTETSGTERVDPAPVRGSEQEPSPEPEEGLAQDPSAQDTAGAPARRRDPRRTPVSRSWSFVRESVIVLGSAIVLSLLIKTFLVQAFFIPSASMEDTLVKGDRVLVNKLVPSPMSLHRGDVVVFKDPGDWLANQLPVQRSALQEALAGALTFVGLLPQDSGEHLIKRVIGLGGDTVACRAEGGRLSVNGVELDEPYLKTGAMPCDVPFEVVVPDDALWVMGDNRQNSGDSRAHMGGPGGGFVPVENVVGTAFVKVWPLDRAGVLRNPGDTFEPVPAP